MLQNAKFSGLPRGPSPGAAGGVYNTRQTSLAKLAGREGSATPFPRISETVAHKSEFSGWTALTA